MSQPTPESQATIEMLERLQQRETHTRRLVVLSLEEEQEIIDKDDKYVDTAPICSATAQMNSEENCKLLCGFTPGEFNGVFSVVQYVIPENVSRGKSHKYNRKDRLFITLVHLKHYENWGKLAVDTSMTTAGTQKMVKDTLVAIQPILVKKYIKRYTMTDAKQKGWISQEFKEALCLADVTFQETYKPKASFDEAKQWFSGKHHKYGVKSQTLHMLNGICCFYSTGIAGATHDLDCITEMIEQVKEVLHKTEEEVDQNDEEDITDEWAIIADLGYQGLQANVRCFLPHKRKKGQQLNQRQKEYNQRLASVRVRCENWFGRLKTLFRCMASKYRGDRATYGVYFGVCAALTNLHCYSHPLRLNARELPTVAELVD